MRALETGSLARGLLRGGLGAWLLLLWGALLGPGPAGAVTTVCAKVRMDVRQEMALERQGFDAHMRITNGLTHAALENVNISVWVTDGGGNPVGVTSDPNDTSALFFLRLETMQGVSDVGGAGVIGPATEASIHWLLIPAPGASNGAVQGTLYRVGARLTYTVGGEPNEPRVLPDTIYVKPMPRLTLDYFLPTDVYGDDAFTPEIEPSEPFSFGLRVRNRGPGPARSVRVESAQPRIVDNEQGLLVGFAIEGSEVGGKAATRSLRVDFGDVPADACGTARWRMTCSVSGTFTSFEAAVTHADELGGQLTSLVEAVHAHTLVRDVLVDLPGRDAIRDFLADDGGVLRVYESQNGEVATANVSAQSSLRVLALDGTRVTYELTTPVAGGFTYLRLPDPQAGVEVLAEVVRSDGKRIRAENAWLSKSRDRQTKQWQHFFHVFDTSSTGRYTVVYETRAPQNLPPVLQFLANRTVVEGRQVSFLVEASDPNGTVPALTAAPLPVGARFADAGDGTGLFDWTPAVGQAGAYEIAFGASDGVLEHTRRATITVRPAWDTDGDGMADAWELEHFGDLSRDGTGDLDGDGVSDLEEYLRGTDPATNFAPTIPVVLAPAPGAEVAELRPVLTVRNSTDREGDPVVYEIEVFEDALFTLGVASASGIAEGTDVTAWPVPLDLRENTRYHWRVRAADGNRASQWAYGSFFVNPENEAPGAFALSWPADGFEVDTLTPALAVTNSRDPDEDPLTYAFEVYEDEALTLLSASVSGVVEGAGGPGGEGTTSWTVDEPLLDGATYWWKAVATDEHGVSTESAVGSFVVNLANHAPTVPLLAAPGAGSEVSETALALVVANAADPDADPDGDPLTYTFELDTVPTFDSPEKQAMAGILEGTGGEPGQTSWEVPGALRDDTRYYWRAKASDGAAESPWTAVATFFVSTANDPPSAPTLRNPSDGGEVGSTTPLLVLKDALDPEEESLTYDYELYADAGLTTRVAAAEGQGLAWAPPQALDDDRFYYWRARAVDAHGLAGEWMAAARFVVNEAAFLDPPAVALTLPGPGGLRTNQAAVALAWTASNPSGTALVSLYFDEEGAGYAGTLIAAGLAPEAGAYAWDVTALPEGTYYVYAAIEDSHGVAKAYAPGSVILDRTPPATSASPPGGLYAAPQLVTLTADDEDAVIRYATCGVLPDASSPVYTGPIAVESSTVLSFFAVDPAGNPGEVRAEAYVIDTEPPAVAIASPLPGLTNDPAPVLAYSVSDGTARVLVDGVEVGKVSGDRLDPLADGPHTVRVEATDAAGNVGFAEVSFGVETAAPTELLVPVRTSRGSGLPGVRVYAFTAAGAYTGKSATADASGVARFDPELFAAGSYKLRADYLGYPFWSAVFPLPGTGVVSVEIAEETAAVQVTQGGAPKAGVKVYLFTGAGAYLGRFAITDAAGMVRFDLPAGKDYKLRADLLGGQYWSDVLAVGAGAANAFAVITGGGVLTATVDSGDGTPVVGANVYLFSASGSYLGLSKTTDTAGRVSFDVPTAGYKLRCDLLGYQFWSDLVTVTTDTAIPFPIPHRDVTARVAADYAGSREAKPYVRVYLFTEAGSYLGRYQDTNEAGEVTFRLPERAYKLRADVLAFQYWSEPFSWTDPTLVIPEGTAEVRVTQAEQPVAGVKVYAFTAAGAYLSLHGVTLADGTASFRLPAQTYRFRADHQGSQYWSADTALLSDQVNSVPVLTGGGAFTLRVTDLAGTPLAGLPCYLFGEAGSYLGESRTTTSAGEAGFDLADGTYRFRVDHKGYSFWTAPAAVTAAGPFGQGLGIDQRATTAAVQRDYGGALVPAQAIPVYLFTEAGAYLGERRTTDAAGQAVFDLPDRSYKVRADYLSAQFWSDPFTAADPVITIAEGQAEVAVTQAGSPVAGVKVYAFNAGGTYLGLNETTDQEGKAYFWLPEGTYRFRTDVQGSQYFANATLVPHQVNPVELSTGGGPFQLVLDDASGPLAGVRVYAFTASGAYLGLYGTTDAAGTVAFNLSDGSYRFRADFLGYPFWSGPHDVPHQSSALFSIPHQEVTVTVEGQDLTPFPLPGVRTYLFTEGGAYLNRYADTNAAGQVHFRLPEQSYQVRADYLGYSFWSEPFTGVDPTVIVEHGTAAVRVTRGVADLAAARVYLFTAAGAYQGRFETTDNAGTATFLLPDQGYKLRVDIDGTQTWSGVVEIQGGVTNPVAVDVAAP